MFLLVVSSRLTEAGLARQFKINVDRHGSVNGDRSAQNSRDMADHDKSSTSWCRKVALVIGWFLLWPTVPFTFAILIALGVYAVTNNYVSEIAFRKRMRNCGRFLRHRDLSARIIREGSGTLIIESPSLGWGFTHAWWSSERTLDIAPSAPPTDDEYRTSAETMHCHDWDRWHWDNYVNPDNGKAYLLRVWNGASIERWLRRQFPDVDVVHTWTALIHFPTVLSESDGAEPSVPERV